MAERPAPAKRTVEIPGLNLRTVTFRMHGTTRLVVHRFPEKAKKLMRAKQMGEGRVKKPPKNPQEDYLDSIYWIDRKKNQTGVPARAIKASMVGACRHAEGLKMTFAKGAFFVKATDREEETGDELLRLVDSDGKPAEHRMREDMVRNQTGVADIRYRAEYLEWGLEIPIEFNANSISEAELANLLNLAGFSQGICEGRPSAPETPMDWGRFKLGAK